MGNYIAVLSDDSLDRDDEIVGKQALQKIMANDGYTAILLNHKNDVLGQIGEWINKRLETINGHTAFVAEPKFYLSNPNAQIIKGCLDEGAQYGISIGAIPISHEPVEKNGKRYKMYTDLEILEASFVAIPSNRHGMAMAVAKMFTGKNTEESNMAEEPVMEKKFTQKDMDDSLSKWQSETESVQKAHDELKKQVDELTIAKSQLTETVEKQTIEIDTLKKMSVMKGDLSTEETGDINQAAKEMQKAIEDGKLPIYRR
jgi:hypothetical protein